MLTKEESVKLIMCINETVRSSMDPMATAMELMPIRQKLEQVANKNDSATVTPNVTKQDSQAQ